MQGLISSWILKVEDKPLPTRFAILELRDQSPNLLLFLCLVVRKEREGMKVNEKRKEKYGGNRFVQ